MTTFYNFASKLCGSLAGVCAILAVLATPTTVWADDLSDCEQCCAATQPENYEDCVAECEIGIGDCAVIFCESSCNQTSGCGGIFCLCATPGWTCKNKIGSATECECRLG